MESVRISEDRLSRIPAEMRQVISGRDLFIDVHCHVFNYRDVPDRFLGIRIPQNERLLAYIEKKLHGIIKRSDTDKYSNLAYFIQFLRAKTTYDITEKLFSYYDSREIIVCPLMMDMAQGIAGSTIDDFKLQIEKLKELRNKYPGKILPFIALDPNNPEMKANFQKVFSADEDYRFYGVKIYPSLGYLPSHPDLMEVFEICEGKRIPVTAHCSGASVHTSRKRIENIQGLFQHGDGSWSEGKTDRLFRKKGDYADFFNHPSNWKPVLEAFPGLKLNLAHFGGDAEWNKFARGETDTWVHSIIEMIHRYKGLYTDFSYTLYNDQYSKALRIQMEKDDILMSRVLFGSDYYMIVTEGHFRTLLKGFTDIMGDEIMSRMGRINPVEFLFK